jgi:hypothetical protein
MPGLGAPLLAIEGGGCARLAYVCCSNRHSRGALGLVPIDYSRFRHNCSFHIHLSVMAD